MDGNNTDKYSPEGKPRVTTSHTFTHFTYRVFNLKSYYNTGPELQILQFKTENIDQSLSSCSGKFMIAAENF